MLDIIIFISIISFTAINIIITSIIIISIGIKTAIRCEI